VREVREARHPIYRFGRNKVFEFEGAKEADASKMEVNASQTGSRQFEIRANVAVGSLPLNNERLLWMGSL
jgi:hypothetical protein